MPRESSPEGVTLSGGYYIPPGTTIAVSIVFFAAARSQASDVIAIMVIQIFMVELAHSFSSVELCRDAKW